MPTQTLQRKIYTVSDRIDRHRVRLGTEEASTYLRDGVIGSDSEHRNGASFGGGVQPLQTRIES
jgi:hypothetical protein